MSNTHTLPDSRLGRVDLGSVVVDWPMPDGRTIRCECVAVFCANCGKPYGWVPKENTTFTCWLCRPCHEKYGTIAGTYAVPEDEFNRAVVAEMEARFGRALTADEIAFAEDRGILGPALEKLMRESPYASHDNRPKG